MGDTLASLSSDTTELTLKANESAFIGTPFTVKVSVINFLNTMSNGSKTILRENKELPQARLEKATIEGMVSGPIKVQGKNLLLTDLSIS